MTFTKNLIIFVFTGLLAVTFAVAAPPPRISNDLEKLLQTARREAGKSLHPLSTGGHPELLTPEQQKANGIITLEGDMDISDDEDVKPSLYKESGLPAGLGFDVIADKRKRWPNGRVPYVIDERFSPTQKKIIHHAMDSFRKETCVRFEPKTTADRNYLFVRLVAANCFSKVGYKNKPRQLLNYAPECFNAFGTILHELMHVIGFFHTQSRTDRDNYVTIDWAILRPGMQLNFQKLTSAEIDDQGQPYDFGSLMHYPDDAFAIIPQQKTILPKLKLPKTVKMGQREYFSELDIKKINILYNCKNAVVCDKNEIPCGGGDSAVKCGKTCDGIVQCPDSRDERSCPKPTCPSPNMWQCDTVKCVPRSWLCDGTRDCPNGEDEKPTNCQRRKCASTDFDCGKCVPAYRVCDGTRDCAQGQDEEAKMCYNLRRPQTIRQTKTPPTTQPNFNIFSPPQQNYYSPYFQQGFGATPLTNYFNPFAAGALGFDARQPVQRHCFFDLEALHQRPEISLTLDNIKYFLYESDPDFCNLVSIGYAQIDPETLELTFGQNAKKETKVLNELKMSNGTSRLNGFIIVVGSADSAVESPAIQMLRLIGADVAKSDKFAAQVVSTLRKWNASGLSLQWLKPQLGDQAAFTGLIRALANAFQYDPYLQTNQTDSNEKKLRLVLSVNVVPEVQPAHNKQFIWSNVDYVNVIPDRQKTRKSNVTLYTNQLLSSLASTKVSQKSLTPTNADSWLVEDEQFRRGHKNGSIFKRINVGIEFAPLTWTLNASSLTQKQHLAGEPVRALGLPGPLSGTVGTMNVGEICLLENTTAKANTASMWHFAVDSSKVGGGAPYAYKLASGQWIAYETPASLKTKLKAADLSRFNGVYVVDAQNDNIRNLCGMKQYELMKTVAKVDELVI